MIFTSLFSIQFTILSRIGVNSSDFISQSSVSFLSNDLYRPFFQYKTPISKKSKDFMSSTEQHFYHMITTGLFSIHFTILQVTSGDFISSHFSAFLSKDIDNTIFITLHHSSPKIKEFYIPPLNKQHFYQMIFTSLFSLHFTILHPKSKDFISLQMSRIPIK